MKLRSVLGLSLALCVLMLLWQCYPDKSGYSLNRRHDLEEFKGLSRVEQVKKCGSCHQREYENEMKGPHAHSYLSLLKHQQFVNSASYDCPYYTAHVNRTAKDCTSCHASMNLFETINTTSDDYLSLADSLLKVRHLLTSARTDPTGYITGVDCMTCHFDGKEVVTNANFVRAMAQDCPSYCSPVASRMFTDNMNCYPCHQANVATLHPEIVQQGIKSVSCLSCHEEHDSNGKPTHYMYWRGELLAGKKDFPLDAMLSDIQATIKDKTVEVKWDNRHFPHQMGECPEWLINFKVIDMDSEEIGERTIRLNRKEYYDGLMYAYFGNKNLPGVPGGELSLAGKPLVSVIALKKVPKQASLKITASSKGQYWFPDSLRTQLGGKTIRLWLSQKSSVFR